MFSEGRALSKILKLATLGGALSLAACATTYKDFKTANVKPGEGVVVGKINVMYNGKNHNKDCGVCFNSINGPCQMLTEEGYVIQNLPAGEASVRRLACKDVSLQHFNIDGANFKQAPGVTYIGQIEIDWTNKGGFKATDLFGLVGALIAESKNDGTVKISVAKGEPDETVRMCESISHQEKVKPTVHLLNPVQ
jgi:hypothetical protein